MRLLQLFLAVCLLASLACDGIDSINLDLDLELLTVTVTTGGVNLDADGYTLSITGRPDEAIGINESRVFSISGDNVTVQLSGVAGNCVVDNNPQAVNISGPTTVTFTVACS